MAMVKWIAGFLEERQAMVKFGDLLSKTRKIRQRVTQGSAFSLSAVPAVHQQHLNELLERELPSLDAETAVFGDDVTILVCDI